MDADLNNSLPIINEKEPNDQLKIANLHEPKRRSPRSLSSQKRTFSLYPNGMSDWDSTDSESGINETNGNYGEPETCQTHFWFYYVASLCVFSHCTAHIITKKPNKEYFNSNLIE